MRSDPPVEPPKEEQEGDLLTTAETLKKLGISRPTLYKLIREGRISPVPGNPVLQIQKRNYFRLGDVERLKREGRRAKAHD